MHRAHMRLADGIVHDVRTWRTSSTACGAIVFDIPREPGVKEPGIYARFRIVGSGPVVDDPVDCMSCIVARRTPFAVLCDEHGQQFLTDEQYSQQLLRPDSFWACPRCGESAHWDDDEYEAALENYEPGPEDA